MQDKEVGNGNTNCPNGTRGKWHNIFIGGKHHLIYQLLLLLNQLFIQGHTLVEWGARGCIVNIPVRPSVCLEFQIFVKISLELETRYY
jgi:hypothetical protein